MIDYDLLDQEFEQLPSKEKIAPSMKPEGSLTDNLRVVKPRRDGAHKRLREIVECLTE